MYMIIVILGFQWLSMVFNHPSDQNIQLIDGFSHFIKPMISDGSEPRPGLALAQSHPVRAAHRASP